MADYGYKEEVLKNYILTKYKSVREFAIDCGIPYTTFLTILKRGIDNANINNIFKICKTLNISADALAEGLIVPYASETPKYAVEVKEIIEKTKSEILDTQNLYFNGKPATKEDISFILSILDTIPTMRTNQMKRIQAYDKRLREIKKHGDIS